LISKETISTILETARIEEVVGDFVVLKKNGSNLKGLCPFHKEKTPSFLVSPAKGIYKCFGCAKGGNALQFIMDHEQLSYPEALRYLAKKYNIEVEEDQTQVDAQNEAYQEKEKQFVIHAFAQKTYTEYLWNTDDGKSIAYPYFKERGFNDETIHKFQLGYSPSNRRFFTEAALKEGFLFEDIVKSGISIGQDVSRAFDRFADRVMFPIHNPMGRIIGFGGRIMRNDKEVAKYLNSPENPIYHKSNVLYGIYFAKKAIAINNSCFLVEGYTDVISLHQCGIENVVASSGTSLTTEQIALIKRYTQNITILYDGDAAGIKASLRGIDMILQEGMKVKIVLFPDGEDPDSFAKKHSADEVNHYIKTNADDLVIFKGKLLYKETENDPIKKAEAINQILQSIALVDDMILRQEYVVKCAQIFQSPQEAFFMQLANFRRTNSEKNNQKKNQPQPENLPPPSETYESNEAEQNIEVYTDLNYENQYFKEKEIIKILILYSNKEILSNLYIEEKKEEFLAKVGDLILAELEQDQFEFKNEIHQNIYKEFVASSFKGYYPEERYFLLHHNHEIAQAAAEILKPSEEISDKWQSRYQIFVPGEDHKLDKTTLKSLLKLKLSQLNRIIEELDQKIKLPTDNVEKQIEWLTEKKHYLQIRALITQELGTVILPEK
jgi:DNA primase